MSRDTFNRYQIRIDGRLAGHVDGLTAGDAEENARSKFKAGRSSRVTAILAEPRKTPVTDKLLTEIIETT
jgi:hypothetical protein